MINLKKQLSDGGVLQFKNGSGFSMVTSSGTSPVNEAIARQAVQTKVVRPNGIGHGFYLFALSPERTGEKPSTGKRRAAA